MNNPSSPQLIDAGAELSAAGLVHRVAQPQTPGPYPTAVLIHGRAGTEDVLWVFRRAIPHGWLIVTPRAIYPDPNEGGYAWTLEESRGAEEQGSGGEASSGQSAGGSGDEDSDQSPISNLQSSPYQHPDLSRSHTPAQWPTLAMFDEGVAALERFIRALPALYNADPDRVVLMGFSQGAAVSFALALKHPQLVKAIASLVGFIPEGAANLSTGAGQALQSPISDLPVFMAVGNEDKTIPLEKARETAEILRTADADLTYQEYDTGHKLNAQGSRDLASWWSRLG